LVDFLLRSQRMHDFHHLVLNERVTLVISDGVEARKYSCGLAILQSGVDRWIPGRRKERPTIPFEISHLGLSGITLW
jgi:hypothetical protein